MALIGQRKAENTFLGQGVEASSKGKCKMCSHRNGLIRESEVSPHFVLSTHA